MKGGREQKMEDGRQKTEAAEQVRENELKFAAKIWKALPVSTRAHLAHWLAIVYRGQICTIIRDNGHCRATLEKEK